MYSAEVIKSQLIKWLLKGHLSFNSSSNSIGTEVLFSSNKRKADLLILSEILHAIEIKSDYDDTKKLHSQLKDYQKTFDKVTIITTPKHIKKISKMINPRIGLILFSNGFHIQRLPKQTKKLNKYALLMFLNKQELLNLSHVKNNKKKSTDYIRKCLSKRLTRNAIRNAAYNLLKKRYDKLFKLFLQDTKGKFSWDELRGLSGEIKRLRI